MATNPSPSILKPLKKTNNNPSLNVVSWNIKRGLYAKEEEIKQLINDNDISILGLQETDLVIDEKSAPQLKDFTTVLPIRSNENAKIRILLFVRKEIHFTVRTDLMSSFFQSIWIETDKGIFGFFYREWKQINKTGSQEESCFSKLKLLCNQIKAATKCNKDVFVMGDMNLCAHKWNSPAYIHKHLAEVVKSTLAESGMYMHDVGTTYYADHKSKNGEYSRSALDHIYSLSGKQMEVEVLENGTSDHLPIKLVIQSIGRKTGKKLERMMRNFKDFNAEKFKKCLAGEPWEILVGMDVNEQVGTFEYFIKKALDECVPLKKIKCHNNYLPGLSKETLKAMTARRAIMRKIKKAKGIERDNLQKQRKLLRNKCLALQRRDVEKHYIDKYNGLTSQKDVWSAARSILTPKDTLGEIPPLKKDGIPINEETKVAEELSCFFVKKIRDLKNGIERELVRGPLCSSQKSLKTSVLHFRTVNEAEVKKIVGKLKNKESKGVDDIGIFIIKAALDVLLPPLTYVINTSIISETFPKRWKEAVVIPVFKKGDKSASSNYRPVSILCVMSKVLESVIHKQITKHCLENQLIPESQHGFQQGKSTLTSLIRMYDKWTEAKNKNMSTGVLLFDMSAAFDTINFNVLQRKLMSMSFGRSSCAWIDSYLQERSQRVKVSGSLSDARRLESGVPQGSILGPLLFVLYVHDITVWLDQDVSLFGYADDTVISCSDTNINKIQEKLHRAAQSMLEYCASNELVANASKTKYLLMRGRSNKSCPETSIKVGKAIIEESPSERILGVLINNKLTWSNQFESLRSKVRQKVAILKRLTYQIPRKVCQKMLDGLVLSQVRYALPLFAQVRLTEEDTPNGDMKSLQVLINNALRIALGVKRIEKWSVERLHAETNNTTLNRMAIKATFKLTKLAMNDKCRGLDGFFENNKIAHNQCTRSSMSNQLQISSHVVSFRLNAVKIWNSVVAHNQKYLNVDLQLYPM